MPAPKSGGSVSHYVASGIVARTTRLGTCLAYGAILVGSSTLLGWWLDVETLRTLIPGSRPMVAYTAFQCIVAGSSLVLLARHDAPSWRRRAGRLLAVLLIGLALVSLTEHALALRGIELLPVDRARSAVDTSAALVLLGLALLSLDRRRGVVALPELLAFGGAASALLVLTGYLYEFSYFADAFALPHGVGMAPATALTLLALCAGVLAVRPETGLMAILTSHRAGGTLARRLLLIAMITIPVVGIVATRAQNAGFFPAPGSAVLGTVVSLLVILAALLVLARRLDLADVERSRAENELVQWKRFFDSASFGAAFASADARLLRVNETYAHMHGFEPDEMIGRDAIELYAAAARRTFAHKVATIDEKGHHRYTSEHVRKDGTTFPVLVDAAVVRDAEGRIVYRVAYVQDVTEERDAGAAQARLAALVDSADDAIVLNDMDGKIVAWNRAAERVYGYAASEIIGQTGESLVPPERRAEREMLRERLRRGEPVSGFETERARKDGSRVSISLTASPVRSPEGEIIGISSITRDITDKLAAERALAEAREELERVDRAALAVSEAIAGMPLTGLDRVLAVIADQARSVTGAANAVVVLVADPDQPLESWAASGASDDEVASIVGTLRTLGSLAGVRELEQATNRSWLGVPIVFRGEPTGYIYLAAARKREPFTARDQRVVQGLASHLGSAIEISLIYERVAIERARLQAIISQLPEGVIVLDEHGAVAYENAAALAFRSDRDPERPYDLRWPNGEVVTAAELPLSRAANQRETIAGIELAIRTRSDEMVPILASAAPVRAEAEPVGAVAIFRDIRALKELERLREEWASVIAHDLRQPVNAIQLAADLLLQSGLADRPASWAGRIKRSANRLNQMIEDLLDLSSLEARRIELRREVVRLDELIATVVSEIAGLEGRTHVALEESSDRVLADPLRVHQVLGNLLSNATKYGARETEIRIDARRLDDQVLVSVTNHGPGIPANELPLLFQRFARTRSSRDSGIKGVGLGLYFCKGLVEAHGGRIWVESTPGQTTSFSFTLPAAPRDTFVVGARRKPAAHA